jgi:hypothetical protein
VIEDSARGKTHRLRSCRSPHLAHHFAEAQLERRRTAAKTKRPPIRVTTSAPADIRGETSKAQERPSSDSGIPRLKQIIQNMLLPPEPAQTSNSASKKPSLINLIDDEPPNPQSPTQNISILSSLTPGKFGHVQTFPTNQSQNLSDLSSLTPEKNGYNGPLSTPPNSLPTTLPSSRLDVREPDVSESVTQHVPLRDINNDGEDDGDSDNSSEMYFRKEYGDDDPGDLSDYEFEERTGMVEGKVDEVKGISYETNVYAVRALVEALAQTTAFRKVPV